MAESDSDSDGTLAVPPQRPLLTVAHGARGAGAAATLGTDVCATPPLSHSAPPAGLLQARPRRWQPVHVHCDLLTVVLRPCCAPHFFDTTTPSAVNPPLLSRRPPVQAPEEKARGITINATHGASCRGVPRAASFQPGTGCCGFPGYVWPQARHSQEWSHAAVRSVQ